MDPELRHRACWYGRRTETIPPNIGLHTIADGQLLFCAHQMWYPVVGYQFDVHSCRGCDYFKPTRAASSGVLETPRNLPPRH